MDEGFSVPLSDTGAVGTPSRVIVRTPAGNSHGQVPNAAERDELWLAVRLFRNLCGLLGGFVVHRVLLPLPVELPRA